MNRVSSYRSLPNHQGPNLCWHCMQHPNSRTASSILQKRMLRLRGLNELSKGTTQGRKLTPTLVLLLLNLFTQLAEEEAKPQGAGKEDLTPKLLCGERSLLGKFSTSRALTQGSAGWPRVITWRSASGLMRRLASQTIGHYFFVFSHSDLG